MRFASLRRIITYPLMSGHWQGWQDTGGVYQERRVVSYTVSSAIHRQRELDSTGYAHLIYIRLEWRGGWAGQMMAKPPSGNSSIAKSQ
jgi:hypothetical protein